MDLITTTDSSDCPPHQVRELRSRGVLGDDGEENMHVLVEAVELLAAQLSSMPPPMPPPLPAPSPWAGVGDGPPNTAPVPPPTPPREWPPSCAQHGAETPTQQQQQRPVSAPSWAPPRDASAAAVVERLSRQLLAEQQESAQLRVRLQQMIAAARATPWPHMANTDTIGLPNMGHPLGHVASPMSVPVSAPSSVEAPPPPGSGAVAGAVSWAPETAGADWGEMPTSAEIEAREAAARRAAADARLQTQLLEEQLAARRLQGELASAQQCHAIEQAELSERVRCSRRRVLTLAQHASRAQHKEQAAKMDELAAKLADAEERAKKSLADYQAITTDLAQRRAAERAKTSPHRLAAEPNTAPPGTPGRTPGRAARAAGGLAGAQHGVAAAAGAAAAAANARDNAGGGAELRIEAALTGAPLAVKLQVRSPLISLDDP